jgi:predicted Ser/Thr protein kinase
MMQDMIGRTVGNYQILEELGRGGMAVVYRAYQASLNRYVAIKVLPPQFAFDREFVERFQREAKAAAGLRHPNIVVIHDVGQEAGTYYIVMEYLEGRTLKQVIEQEGPLPVVRAARIVEQVTAALDYAHQRGFVHRDVKPANIFVGEGDRVTLTDFGIAKAASETQHLTQTGMLMGTPEYMSPEQAGGGQVDHRTDLYALGVVLYQMLVGRVPFRGTTPHATLHAVIYEAPLPPRQVNPNLSPAVEAVILKAVAKRPEQRFQRGADMVAALRTALSGPTAGEPVAAVAAAHVVPPPRIPFQGEPQPAGTKPISAGPPRSRAPAAAVPSGQRSPAVLWIMAGIAGVAVLLLAVLLFIAVGGGGGETPVPATTVAIAWKTATQTPGGAIPTAGLTDTSAPLASTEAPPATEPSAPTDTPAPSTDTSLPPTNTSVPPTNTPKPPTATATATKPPTHTPTATPTTPPPPPACAFDAQGLFAGLWQTYRNQLGCPATKKPQGIQDAEEAFENGHMFWRQDNDYAYVVYGNGTYQAFTDLWTEGDPEYSCAASPPPSRVQPKRGFGKVWCNLGGPGAAIGWALGEEAGFGPGYGDPMVQDFEHGFIFRDSDGKNTGMAYVFFSSSGTFVRVHY